MHYILYQIRGHVTPIKLLFPQVKVLYVRNLQLNTTEETIENIFKKYAEVERVKKIKDYCFVHFSTKEGARRALEDMQGTFYSYLSNNNQLRLLMVTHCVKGGWCSFTGLYIEDLTTQESIGSYLTFQCY